MRLVSFRDPDGRSSWGATDGEGVVDLGSLMGDRFPSVRALLAADAVDEAEHNASWSSPTRSLGEVTLLPPVPDPARILCAGVNYEEHRRETGRDPSAAPTIFTRYPSSLVGHDQPLCRPHETQRFDYEGELAAVIGRPARRVPAEAALDHVAGYTAFMDGSVRDFQRMTSQFTPGKNFDASGSAGPWLVTADEVGDPQALALRTRLDGEVVQEADTSLMIFSVAELIAFCSVFTTLEPGDVIATGTPGGVGDRRDPPRYLVPGSVVEVEITGIGTLANGVIDG